MDFNSYFNDFSEAYDEAIEKITYLRQCAEQVKESMESIIDSCETIENEI